MEHDIDLSPLVLDVARDSPGALGRAYIARSKQGAPTIGADRVEQ
jgi:hypothetical protein